MKTEPSILIAFILNLLFSVFEFFGGIFIGSIAILSDALHDAGDAASIGISYFMEKKSKKHPDEKYTYGYGRFSVLGGAITTLTLLVGSFVMIYNATKRIINPVQINYNVMIIFAVVGILVNLCGTLFTRKGDSLNQKAVNLHLLEDVFGWAVVLIGAVVMKFTDISVIDPVLSVAVSVFIIINAVKNLKEILSLFLEKAPRNIELSEIKEHIEEIDGILDVHHIHLWSLDGHNNFATLHIVTDSELHSMKERIRRVLYDHGIGHVTIETENSSEPCPDRQCCIEFCAHTGHCHSHGHHSH